MIEVKNLTKEFKETKALDNVSLRFATGKIHGLIGRNGSGKTVLSSSKAQGSSALKAGL